LHGTNLLFYLFFFFYFYRSTTPQQWEDYSKYNKERADAEMLASNRLREAIHHTLHQCANDLEAQKIATEYAYRKRIREMERAKDELEWQKKNVCIDLF
jgi:tektin-2